MVAARYRDDVDIARTLTAAVAKDDNWYVARCLEVEVPATFDHPLVTPIEIRIPA